MEMAQLDAADSMPGLFSYKTIAIIFLLGIKLAWHQVGSIELAALKGTRPTCI